MGCPFAFAEAKHFREPGFQCCILVLCRGVSDEVQQAGCSLLVEGCDGVVVLGSITRYSAEVELRLCLGKPYLSGWEGQKVGSFNVTACSSAMKYVLAAGSPMWRKTNFFLQNNKSTHQY